MELQEIVEKTERLGDRVSVAGLSNGYAIGFEIFKEREHYITGKSFRNERREDDIKYAIFGNFSDSQNIYDGHNANFLSDNISTGFTFEAQELLEQFSQRLRSPMKELGQRRETIYNEMLKPLGIVPVHKRKWSYSLPIIGRSLTYPLSVPLMYLNYRRQGVRDIDGVPILIPLLTIPSQLKSAIKELISPSQKGHSITNKSLLKSISDKVSPGICFLGGEEPNKSDNPDCFGDGSGDGRPFLDLVFPDGLTLCRNHASYPKDKNHYDEMKYYLPVAKDLIKEIYLLEDKEKSEWQRWRDFRKSVKREDVEKLLKSFSLS